LLFPPREREVVAKKKYLRHNNQTFGHLEEMLGATRFNQSNRARHLWSPTVRTVFFCGQFSFLVPNLLHLTLEQEDLILTHAVHKRGTKDWKTVASEVPGRSAKQCRERWVHNIDPVSFDDTTRPHQQFISTSTNHEILLQRIKRGNWTADEDSVILNFVAENGFRWGMLADLLPGR
jgi:hypothetical protein